MHMRNASREKIEELQSSSQEKLRAKEEEVSGHLKSMDGLQEQIRALEQGSTDGAKVADDLQKQIEDLKQAHEAALKIKTDENEELVQQLDAYNDQLSADAKEIQELKDETEGLRKTIQTLEQVSQQDEGQHAAKIAKVQAELNEAKSKADSHKAELDAMHEKHQQNLDELEAGRGTLKQHENDLADRSHEVEALKREISTMKETSDSATKDFATALAKHQQVEEDRAAL